MNSLAESCRAAHSFSLCTRYKTRYQDTYTEVLQRSAPRSPPSVDKSPEVLVGERVTEHVSLPREVPATGHVVQHGASDVPMKASVQMTAGDPSVMRTQNSYDGNSRNSILAVVNHDLQDKMQKRVTVSERNSDFSKYRTATSGQMYGSRSSFMSQADALAQHMLNVHNVGSVRTVHSMPVLHAGVPSVTMTGPVMTGPVSHDNDVTWTKYATTPNFVASSTLPVPSPKLSTPTSPAPAPPAESMALESRVLVHSMGIRPELNGQLGTVKSFLPHARIGVLLDLDQEAIQALKSENLRLVLSEGLQNKSAGAPVKPATTSQVSLPA